MSVTEALSIAILLTIDCLFIISIQKTALFIKVSIFFCIPSVYTPLKNNDAIGRF
jgi:hypothetical protein